MLIDFRLIFFDRVGDKQTRARLFRLWLWLLGCFSGIGVEWGELSDFLRVFFLWPGEDWWEHGAPSTTKIASVFWGGERVPAATVGLLRGMGSSDLRPLLANHSMLLLLVRSVGALGSFFLR